MLKFENGQYLEMTAEEILELNSQPQQIGNIEQLITEIENLKLEISRLKEEREETHE